MVVAQLVERLLPSPEVRGLNPFIGKIYIERLLSTVLKRQNKEERDREWLLFRSIFSHFSQQKLLASAGFELGLSE